MFDTIKMGNTINQSDSRSTQLKITCSSRSRLKDHGESQNQIAYMVNRMENVLMSIEKRKLDYEIAIVNLAPLRSAIEMMEQWNDGTMGSGILELWV